MRASSTRPGFRSIRNLAGKNVPDKTWKHFYSPAEAWERVVAANVAALRAAGEQATGLARSCCTELPKDLTARRPEFLPIVGRHHLSHYAPAYRLAVENRETQWALHTDIPDRWNGLAPNAILVAVVFAKSCIVITAFRPAQRFRGVVDEGDFMLYAKEYYLRHTKAEQTAQSSPLLDWLRAHHHDAPSDTGQVWRFALAVGRARSRRLDSADAAALREAEATLRQVPAEAREELRRALDWQGALEALRAGVDDSEPDELVNALLAAEDLLAVAEAIGDSESSSNFLEDAEFLNERMPAGWSYLERFANRRLADAAAMGAPPNRIWVMARIAAQRSWRAALDLLADAEWLPSTFIGSIQLHREAYLGAPATWWIEGTGSVPTGHTRAFVIAPDGHIEDVTDLVAAGASQLWELDTPGDSAALVTFEASAPIPGLTLAEVVAEAQRRPDITVSRREFSRPN